MSEKKPAIAAVADPMTMRILPELACEIGLNESIALLQISFWIKIANNLRDNQYWTFQSIRDMKDKAFGFWSIATINRVIKSLEDKGLVTIGNYNKRKGDNTRWIALNVAGIEALTSVHIVWLGSNGEVFQNETARFKMKQGDADAFQNETPLSQNETTLPETTTETTVTENRTENKEPAQKQRRRNVVFDAVALHIFEIADPSRITGNGGSIGSLATAVKKQYTAQFETFDETAAAESVKRFATSLGKDQLKFVQNKNSFPPKYIKFLQDEQKGSKPRQSEEEQFTTPPIVLTDNDLASIDDLMAGIIKKVSA